MSPPISKDWWLAAALTGAALPGAMGQTPTGTSPAAGVVTRYEAGKPIATQTLYVTAATGHRVTTGPGQTVHVLFPDQSALTVGPDSEIVISRYDFEARSKSGNMAVEMTKGFLRVVGGYISKGNPIMVRTATATVGIRGGIAQLWFDPAVQSGPPFIGNMLFGIQMLISNLQNEVLGELFRPGSGFSFGPVGLQVFTPLEWPGYVQLVDLSGRIGPYAGLTGEEGPATGPGTGTEGGTLPDPNANSDTLSSDRLPDTTTVGSPNQGGTTNPDGNPTLPQVLGGTPSPGNQS